MTRRLDPNINGFSGLTMEHFYVKFGALIFAMSCGKTGKLTNASVNWVTSKNIAYFVKNQLPESLR